MLKLKNRKTGKELNINAAHVISFFPADQGSEILVTGGVLYKVYDSTRTIRHQMKKALWQAASGAPLEG